MLPFRRRPIGPSDILLLSFGGLILVGTALLRIPLMQAAQPVSWLDCLFTATSAVCVTGLITVDTATAWSSWGQLLIALLIQLGGLGIMTFSMAMIFLTGQRPSLRTFQVLQGSLGPVRAQEVGHLARDVVAYTLTFELVGALLLWPMFSQDHAPLQALALAGFHAVSAFCNAGFSLFSNSLEAYPQHWGINLVVMLLITLGGLGFVVLRELRGRLGPRRAHPRLSLHTRLVLITSAVLTLGGAAMLLFTERLAGPGAHWGAGWWPAFFCSVTARTAGFNTVSLGELSNASILLLMGLMFVGASPGSTGGGVKTTTLAALWAVAHNRRRGLTGASAFGRNLTDRQVGAATSLVLLSVVVVMTGVLLLVDLETGDHTISHQRGAVLEQAFEAVSAFATVGLSLGATAKLTLGGKLVIIALMFLGRLGPLTFIYALAGRIHQPRFQLAQERIMLG